MQFDDIYWELHPDGDASFRVDIAHDSDSLLISEVKRYTGESSKNKARGQVIGYRNILRQLGVRADLDETWVDPRNVSGVQVMGTFKGAPNSLGAQETFVVWGEGPGPIFFDNVKDVRKRAHSGRVRTREK